jgi:hypothetical protein
MLQHRSHQLPHTQQQLGILPHLTLCSSCARAALHPQHSTRQPAGLPPDERHITIYRTADHCRSRHILEGVWPLLRKCSTIDNQDTLNLLAGSQERPLLLIPCAIQPEHQKSLLFSPSHGSAT